MSFVDNDPPKDLDVGSLTSDESINIYSAGQNNKITQKNLSKLNFKHSIT